MSLLALHSLRAAAKDGILASTLKASSSAWPRKVRLGFNEGERARRRRWQLHPRCEVAGEATFHVVWKTAEWGSSCPGQGLPWTQMEEQLASGAPWSSSPLGHLGSPLWPSSSRRLWFSSKCAYFVFLSVPQVQGY